MNVLTRQIYDYLLEIEQNETAHFLYSHCSIENQYVDTLFDMVGEGQRDMFDISIYTAPKIYKELKKYSKLIAILEEAIRENAEADGIVIRNTEWFPRVRTNLEFSNKTIEYLKGIITGDSGKTEYLSGSKLVNFFNSFGYKDVYENGFPSRWKYTEEKLKELNSEGRLKQVIEDYFKPINFVQDLELLKNLIDELNRYLAFDDLYAKIIGKKCLVSSKTTNLGISTLQKIDHEFIEENIDKCDKKIFEGDYSGAITNARSLVETVLIYIKTELTGEVYKFNGDLNALYKEISKDLNLSVERDKKIDDSFKKIISGFFSIIAGIAELGNDLGDRHGKSTKKYKIEKRHALLVINASKTFCEFIFSSFDNNRKQ